MLASDFSLVNHSVFNTDE